MTSKVLTGFYGDYLLKAPVTSLTVAASGYVGDSGHYGIYTTHPTANAYTVLNEGTVKSGQYGVGIFLADGGLITNGTASDTTALIESWFGVKVLNASATVRNFATIIGVPLGPNVDEGVYLGAGGLVVNGSATDTAALISGKQGVSMTSGAVQNFATIEASGAYGGIAVQVSGAGRVTNGASNDQAAAIMGSVYLFGAGTVTNFGTIQSSGAAVDRQGGLVTNGAANDTNAMITGLVGVVSNSAAATVRNFGTITGELAVTLGGGGLIVNGSAVDKTATISGGEGLALSDAPVSVTNFGTIGGTDAVDCYRAPSRVTNYGTIESTSTIGYAIRFRGAGVSTLVVEAGSTILGAMAGGGGVLDLATGSGTIAGIAAGAITAAGAVDPYAGFGTLEIAKGSAFTLTGAATMASGGVTVLDVEGSLAVTGSLTSSGTISGAGALSIDGGELDLGVGSALAVARLTILGATSVFSVTTNLIYARAFTQSAGVLSLAAGDTLKLNGAGDSLSGTVTGAGTLALTGAGDTLKNLTSSIARTTLGVASVNLAGTLDLTGLMTLTCPDAVVVAATVLSGGGTLQLSNLASNKITGALTSTALVNAGDKILGAGQLGAGSLRLFNQAGGIIEGAGAAGLVIDTGAYVVSNAGLIEAASGGSVTILSAVANAGTLATLGGALTVDGAVTGAGRANINGGVASFAAAFTANVAFGAKGELRLANSTAYKGAITGFSTTGTTSLDLEDISFGGTTTAAYSGTAASGELTVTDGTHTARIKLTGNYLTSLWILASDGAAGTVVTDPTPGRTASIPSAPLVQALASFQSTPATREAATQAWQIPNLWPVHARG